MRRLFLLCVLLLGTTVSAQTPTQLLTTVGAGNITANGGTVTLPIPTGIAYSAVGVEAAGTWTGTIQVECAASRQGSGAFVAILLFPRNSATSVANFTANGQWSGSMAGCQRVQARATAAMTGTATITLVGVPVAR